MNFHCPATKKRKLIFLLAVVQSILIFLFIRNSTVSQRLKSIGQNFLNGGLGSSITTPIYSSLDASFSGHPGDNPIYDRFNILPRTTKENVTLLIIVSSAPSRYDRRMAIRDSWWQMCRNMTKNNHTVTIRCIFMTDKQDASSPHFKAMEKEENQFKDMGFQSLSGGVVFGLRYMYHIYWATQNYNFDYMMRMDDDYFLCLNKVINELPMPPMKLFHWGWVHCITGIIRPEESVIMFSRDVISIFLSQNPKKTYCHPWADQLIATWVKEIKLPIVYHTDTRLHHDPPAESMKEFKQPKDVCKHLVGVHGSYPTTMRRLWKNRGHYNLSDSDTLLTHSSQCVVSSIFDWKIFQWAWRYEPKLCINNPSWDTLKQSNGSTYKGRQFNELGVE